MSESPKECPSCHHLQKDLEAEFCAKCRFPLHIVAGKYQLVRLLGEGGFGDVYLARHIRLQQEAERVVKIIKPEVFRQDPTMAIRFEREVQTTSVLSQHCQHIVRIYDDFGEIPMLGHFYVMEYLQGQPLSAFLSNPDELPPLQWVIQIFGQLCDAMRRAHEMSIVHRDLKPDNIMLVRYGDEPHFLKVLDFGIAKPANEPGTPAITQGFLGTPVYMAPELFVHNHEVDHRVDIYAMGVILYELLTGRPPFLADGNAQTAFFRMLNHHTQLPPPSLREIRPDRDIPEALEEVVMRALAKTPDERQESALRLKEEVFHAAGLSIPRGTGSHPPTSAYVPPPKRPSGGVVISTPRHTPHPSSVSHDQLPSQGPLFSQEDPGIDDRRDETKISPSAWQHTPLPGQSASALFTPTLTPATAPKPMPTPLPEPMPTPQPLRPTPPVHPTPPAHPTPSAHPPPPSRPTPPVHPTPRPSTQPGAPVKLPQHAEDPLQQQDATELSALSPSEFTRTVLQQTGQALAPRPKRSWLQSVLGGLVGIGLAAALIILFNPSFLQRLGLSSPQASKNETLRGSAPGVQTPQRQTKGSAIPALPRLDPAPSKRPKARVTNTQRTQPKPPGQAPKQPNGTKGRDGFDAGPSKAIPPIPPAGKGAIQAPSNRLTIVKQPPIPKNQVRPIHRKRRRVRRRRPRRCPGPLKGLGWNRLFVSPSYARLRVIEGQGRLQALRRRGKHCLWFQAHRVKVQISAPRHRSCAIWIYRLHRRLKLKLKRGSAPPQREGYCKVF